MQDSPSERKPAPADSGMPFLRGHAGGAYALLLLAGLLLAPAAARCATETWNPGGAGGGSGTWDTGVTADWNNGVTWSDSNDAVFGGAGGIVTLVAPAANSLTFSASGPYTLESGTLTMTGADITANSSATISSAINAENGIYQTGAGSLTLTGTATLGYSELTVDLGTLNIASGGNVSDSVGFISDNPGNAAAVTVSGSGSAWTNNGYLYVGYSGPATLSIANGGAVSVPGSYYGYAYIAALSGASGLVTVSGSGSEWTNSGYISVGTLGDGAVVVNDGGTVSNDHDAYIGDGVGGDGTVTVSGAGSSWTVGGYLDVGNQGNGTLSVTNGGAVSTTYIGLVAGQAGSTGTLTVSGAGSTLTLGADLDVGGDDSGDLGGAGLLHIASGGSVTGPQTLIEAESTIAFGENATLDSPLAINGGALSLVDGRLQTVDLTEPVTIAAGSTLSFDVGNGSDQIAFSQAGTLALNGASTVNLYGLSGLVTAGTYRLIGAATDGNLSLGNVYNSGNFTYALLSTATSEDVVVTATAPLSTAYWEGGRGNLWSVLLGGTGTNWTTSQAGAVDPRLTPSSTTDVLFSGSGAANQGDTELGADMTIKSLTISDPDPVGIFGDNPNPWLASNTLTISGSTGSTGITIASGAGLVTIGANLVLSGSSRTITVNNAAGLIVSGSLGGASGLIKSGTGIMTLTGSSDLAGPATVSAGALIVSGSLSGAGGVDVAGGELGGSGSISGTATVGSGGILAPAATLSGTAGITLTIGNNVAFNNGSQFKINIDAGSNATDLLSITNGGNLTLSGDTTLTVTLLDGSTLSQPNYVLAVLTGGGTISGQFANLNIPAGYSVDYGTLTPGELQLVDGSPPIPEPGSVPMTFAALALTGAIARRRRKFRVI